MSMNPDETPSIPSKEPSLNPLFFGQMMLFVMDKWKGKFDALLCCIFCTLSVTYDSQ
jgi:hypothetical protein